MQRPLRCVSVKGSRPYHAVSSTSEDMELLALDARNTIGSAEEEKRNGWRCTIVLSKIQGLSLHMKNYIEGADPAILQRSA